MQNGSNKTRCRHEKYATAETTSIGDSDDGHTMTLYTPPTPTVVKEVVLMLDVAAETDCAVGPGAPAFCTAAVEPAAASPGAETGAMLVADETPVLETAVPLLLFLPQLLPSTARTAANKREARACAVRSADRDAGKETENRAHANLSKAQKWRREETKRGKKAGVVRVCPPCQRCRS
jgi:hypothetical protein